MKKLLITSAFSLLACIAVAQTIPNVLQGYGTVVVTSHDANFVQDTLPLVIQGNVQFATPLTEAMPPHSVAQPKPLLLLPQVTGYFDQPTPKAGWYPETVPGVGRIMVNDLTGCSARYDTLHVPLGKYNVITIGKKVYKIVTTLEEITPATVSNIKDTAWMGAIEPAIHFQF